MLGNGKPPRVGPSPQTKFAKKALNIVTYALAGAVIATAMAHWPASAGDVLEKLNLVRGPVAAAPVPDRTHKSDRLKSTVPARAGARDSKSQREPARTETRIEKIPFSCELAFSRVISEGNFSTRCIATIDADARVAAAE